MSIVLVFVLALASMAVVAAEARAGSHSDGFPKQVLMKGTTVLQDEQFYYGTWNWYEAGECNRVFADGFEGFSRADTVGVGSKMRIKLNKPELPATVKIKAYEKTDLGLPVGQGRLLNTTFGRVERDGKTTGWNVFFRVNEPERH